MQYEHAPMESLSPAHRVFSPKLVWSKTITVILNQISRRKKLKHDFENEIEKNKKEAGHKVISLEFIRKSFKSGNPTRLNLDLQDNLKALQDELSKEEQVRLDMSNLEDYVLQKACKLYAILLLIGESHRIFKIFLDANQMNDGIFMKRHEHESPYCVLEHIRTIQHFEGIGTEFFNAQWTIPAVLYRESTPEYPIDYYRFPFQSKKPQEIGSGSGGQVYRVTILKGHLKRDDESYQDAQVAYKSVNMGGDERNRRLMREVETLRACNHDNIVKFYASFIAGRNGGKWINTDTTKCLHLLFEYANGGNLKEWLAMERTPENLKDQKKRGEEIMRHIEGLVGAVSHIHKEIEDYSMYHRDIKPGNIVIFGGEKQIWKICDFGMAALKHSDDESGATLGNSDSSVGTYEYWSPEYAEDKLCGRPSDVFSLGCVLLELATVWKYGWDSRELSKFRKARHNHENETAKVAARQGSDCSYHNNWPVVVDWFRKLQDKETEKACCSKLVELIKEMMNKKRSARVFIWEAQMDIYEMDETRTKDQLISYFRTIVQPSKTSRSALDNKHNPLQRAERRNKKWQMPILEKAKWSMTKPLLDERSSTLKGEKHSNLTSCPQTHDFDRTKFVGRHEIDKAINKISTGKCIGLYGVSGSGKSHLAYHYVRRFHDAERSEQKKHTFWFEAGTEARLHQTILEAIKQVGLKVKEWENPLMVMRDWLKKTSNGPWIVVVDGLDSIPIANTVKCLLPKDIGIMIITTRYKGILEELELCMEKACVQVGPIHKDNGDARNLFRIHNDTPTNGKSKEMKMILETYNLPFNLKMVANYLRLDEIPLNIWCDTLSKKHAPPKIKPNNFLIFLILVHPKWRIRSTAAAPVVSNAPLDLLAELACYNKDDIDIDLFQRKDTQKELQEMLKTLEDLMVIQKGHGIDSQNYCMHGIVKEGVHAWISSNKGPLALLELYDKALCQLLSRYQQERRRRHNGPYSSYLLKLRFMPHFDSFLHFTQKYKNAKELFKQDCSSQMVQSVITFSHVYLDEGRYDDAAAVLEFTRKAYQTGTVFRAELARNFAKPYVLPPLEQKRDKDWQQAATYLKTVITELKDQHDQQNSRWECILDLVNLYCRCLEPNKASETFKLLQEISLFSFFGYTGIWRHTSRVFKDQATEMKLGIDKTIAEAQIYFTAAKLAKCTTSQSRLKKLSKARAAFEKAKAAIKCFLENGVEDRLSSVDQRIADILCEENNEKSAKQALEIYERLLGSMYTGSGQANLYRNQKRKWELKCGVACAQLQLAPDIQQRQSIITSLTSTVSSYERCYGLRHGNHSEHTRVCAKLLAEAYRQTDDISKAHDIETRYGLKAPLTWIKDPYRTIEKGHVALARTLLSAVLHSCDKLFVILIVSSFLMAVVCFKYYTK